MKENTEIVLIHGAGLGGWIWDGLKSLLHVPAWAFEFPERDPNRPVPKSLTLYDYAPHF